MRILSIKDENVDSVEIIVLDVLCTCLAEKSPLSGIARHLAESVSLVAPSSDHEKDFERRLLLLKLHDLLKLFRLLDPDAAVAGLLIDETTVSIVDMRKACRIRNNR